MLTSQAASPLPYGCITLTCHLSMQAIFVDDDNNVLTGPDCSIGLLTQDNVLVIPPDEGGLAGMAAKNVAELCMQVRNAHLFCSLQSTTN